MRVECLRVAAGWLYVVRVCAEREQCGVVCVDE